MEKYSNAEINFNNDKKEAVITYMGNLATPEDTTINMHYGFGLLWEHTNEVEMIKTDNGYMATVEIKEEFPSIHCCFKNEENNWDNNSALNYNFEIEKSEAQAIKIEENSIAVDEETYKSFGQTLSKFFYNLFKSIPEFFRKFGSQTNS